VADVPRARLRSLRRRFDCLGEKAMEAYAFMSTKRNAFLVLEIFVKRLPHRPTETMLPSWPMDFDIGHGNMVGKVPSSGACAH
jgi:hypothetical protein